jgi:phage baseplate assembly protein W
MARVGIDARTGRPIYGWAHCVQSIKKILETEIGARLQRRLFGAFLQRIIDRPQTAEIVIDIYADVAAALEPRTVEGNQLGEPGFVLLRVSIDASTAGHVMLLLSGVYFENGHLGDYSNPSERQISYPLTSEVS